MPMSRRSFYLIFPVDVTLRTLDTFLSRAVDSIVRLEGIFYAERDIDLREDIVLVGSHVEWARGVVRTSLPHITVFGYLEVSSLTIEDYRDYAEQLKMHSEDESSRYVFMAGQRRNTRIRVSRPTMPTFIISRGRRVSARYNILGGNMERKYVVVEGVFREFHNYLHTNTRFYGEVALMEAGDEVMQLLNSEEDERKCYIVLKGSKDRLIYFKKDSLSKLLPKIFER